MKIIPVFVLLIALSVHAQWLPVWSGQSTNIGLTVRDANDADTLDGKYAAMYYEMGGRGTRKWSIIKYNALRTISPAEHYKLFLYARIPLTADLAVAMMVDSTNLPILYSTTPMPVDNEYGEELIDTTLTIDVPANSGFHYGKSFYRFAIIRDHLNSSRATRKDFYIDAVYLEIVRDTIVPRDTLVLSAKPSKRFRSIPRAIPVDILGRPADTLHEAYWFDYDTNGYRRLRIRK